jgi:hypothetical protein
MRVLAKYLAIGAVESGIGQGLMEPSPRVEHATYRCVRDLDIASNAVLVLFLLAIRE